MRIRIPRLAATVDRRLLINYRLDPAVAQSLLPSQVRPQIVDGSAVAGVCLLRLSDLRPSWLRARVGWGAENAAHRIAVEWDDENGETHVGVYIPERHSASWLATVAGGRVFPGIHHHARFSVVETDDYFHVAMTSSGQSVEAEVRRSVGWHSSLFDTVTDASDFFRAGAIGWSPERRGSRLQGVMLETDAWKVEPAEAVSVRSSFFDSLPSGSAVLDCVLLMRKVPITWRTPALEQPASWRPSIVAEPR